MVSYRIKYLSSGRGLVQALLVLLPVLVGVFVEPAPVSADVRDGEALADLVRGDFRLEGEVGTAQDGLSKIVQAVVLA